MSVDVSYTDVYGYQKTKSLVLQKSTKSPTIKENSVAGKNYTWYSTVFVNETFAFNSYNTGRKSGTKGSYKNYPIDFYYIYYDGCVYYQQFNPFGTQTPSIEDGMIRVEQEKFLSIQ